MLGKYESRLNLNRNSLICEISECTRRSLQKVKSGSKIVNVINVLEDLTELKDDSSEDEENLFNSIVNRKKLRVEILGVDLSVSSEVNELLLRRMAALKPVVPEKKTEEEPQPIITVKVQ